MAGWPIGASTRTSQPGSANNFPVHICRQEQLSPTGK